MTEQPEQHPSRSDPADADSARPDEARLRRFLRRGGSGRPAGTTPGGAILLDGGERGTIAVAPDLLRRMVENGALRNSGGMLRLASEGSAEASAVHPGTGRDIGVRRMKGPDGLPAELLVNHAESPLAALARRKDRNGAPFLASAEFEAGERLRADFTRGALGPRLGMNWSAALGPAKGRRSSGLADLTDAALAARLRVETAAAAVGPELSGVLLDVCCFLKGLEQVEAERAWPVRSAKLMLKTALAALARHYDPAPANPGRTSAILQWGSEDYRPKVP